MFDYTIEGWNNHSEHMKAKGKDPMEYYNYRKMIFKRLRCVYTPIRIILFPIYFPIKALIKAYIWTYDG